MAKWFPFLLALLIISCGSPERAIEGVLHNRTNGLKNMNLELYMSSISPDYNDGKNTYEKIKERAERHFLLFDKIDFQVDERTIYLNDKQDEALVVQKYFLEFTLPTGKTEGDKGQERLKLRLGKDGWKIVSGL